jgi:hypothetical protein
MNAIPDQVSEEKRTLINGRNQMKYDRITNNFQKLSWIKVLHEFEK